MDDAAIGTDQTRRFVYVVKADNTVEYRGIEPGPLHEGMRVVVSGLTAGEHIVVNGLQRVRPGAAVTPQQVAMRLPLNEERQQMLVNTRP